MEVKSNINIHNRFDIVVRNAITGEIEQTAKAENMVLDRIYTRLCNFNTYFVNICFGTGTGTVTADRTTMFSYLGYKAATTQELIRAYPTSTWTRSIRLGTEEYNGQTLREVGISDTYPNVNTLALITDSEGNPLELYKSSTRIIDIYATVFVTIWDVDWGLKFAGNGLRNYLTGDSMASDSIGLAFVGNGDDWTTLSSTRTSNVAAKTVQTYVKFNVDHYNKDVRYIQWMSTGLRCELPRTGVFTSHPKTGVVLGTGDGTKTKFSIPNKFFSNLIVYVDGIENSDYTIDNAGNVVFNSPIAEGITVSADYVCEKYIPKDKDHVLPVTMKIVFGGTQPSPVMPEPEPIIAPGSQTPIGGDLNYGFFGEVSSEDLISGDDLCSLLGLTAGTSQNSNAGWLKFTRNGKVLFVAKKTIRHSISWDAINAVGAVFGDRMLVINGIKYIIRLLSSSEWDALMYPIHVDHPSGAPNWWNYTDQDLLTGYNYGNGNNSWTSTPSSSRRVCRGYIGVAYSDNIITSDSSSRYGFRPVLEIL